MAHTDGPSEQAQSDEGWLDHWVFDPCARLLATVPVGEIDADRARPLATGVEGLFRSRVPHEYPGWPPESTTDGSNVDVCVRTDDRVEVFGITYIDFGGEVFPFRAQISASGIGPSLDLFIGNTDQRTGAPPRYRDPALIPIRDDDGEIVAAELIVGRRQLAVEWTSVLQISA